MRPELERLIEMLADIEGVDDLALTTNGTALAQRAEALARAGLGRVTVSLDALEERAFRSMSDTRFPLARVLDGIDAAQDAGLAPVKINMVVRRGVNEHCVLEMAEHFRGRPQVLRFIEYMDVGETQRMAPRAGGTRRTRSLRRSPSVGRSSRSQPDRDGEVASRWAYRDGAGEIGVIHSVTKPFCQGCARARLSADGRLYTCLFAAHGHDLRVLLRGGAKDSEIADRLDEIWTARTDRYSEVRGSRAVEDGA